MSKSTERRAIQSARDLSTRGRQSERRRARAAKRSGIAIAERAYLSLLSEHTTVGGTR